ncbi:MAG TPA: hypothetical protein PKL09_03965 [bacterium]|nr:hypothetical protein [bacterium]HQA63479.1 hypothetical protein [bacterium]
MAEDLDDYQDDIGDLSDNQPDEDVRKLMDDYNLDEDTAEQARELMDEYGLDEDDAVNIAEEGL